MAIATTTQTAAASAPAQTVTEVPKEALGTAGLWMSAYHVGDITGIVGLILTIISARAAFGARRAAREAAAAAIESRNRLEVAAKLSELAQRLKAVRNIYDTADWSTLDLNRDLAATITVELLASLRDDKRCAQLLSNVRDALRDPHQTLDQVKDDSRRQKLQAGLRNKFAVFVDSVETIMHERVKHGT